jgi:anti-anti-sigma factor
MKNLSEHINKLNEDLQFERCPREGSLVFYCRGAFALVSHRQLDGLFAAIRDAEEKQIAIDMREVGYIDSVGVGTLAMCLKYAMAQKKSIILVTNDAVRRALVTAALDTIFIQCDSVEAALERLASGR